MQLVLVRHPPAAIEAGRCYGRLDVQLSARGKADLARLHATLSQTGIARVWTSPARRCRALATALTPVPITDDRLLELDFGAWEGLPWADIPREALDRWAADAAGFAPPDGESGAALLRRVHAICADLLAANEDAIVVTHGGPLKLMPAILTGGAPDLLAPAPPLGSVITLHVQRTDPARTDNTVHSTATAHPPSTSPVNPPS